MDCPFASPARRILALAAVVALGAPFFPEGFAPDASGAPAWVTDTGADFNGTGAVFSGCFVDGNGTDAFVRLNNTFLWEYQNLMVRPPARIMPAMAAVGDGDNVVLFGGRDELTAGKPVFGDTWVYDLSDNRWTQMAPPDRPSKRYGAAMATIPGDDRVVLFGGYDETRQECRNDTWIYDLGDDEWYLQAAGTAPPPRMRHGMVSVANGTGAVLFGGMAFLWGDTLNDTWILDTATLRWDRAYPAAAPWGRCSFGFSAVWGDDKAVLFGGDLDVTTGADTWVYDLGDNEWTQRDPVKPPSRRHGQGMAPIIGDDKVLMYGGMNDKQYPPMLYCETWMYDPGDDGWTLLEYPWEQLPRAVGMMGLAALNCGRWTVLFGGTDGGYGYTPLDATLAYDTGAFVAEGFYCSPVFDAGANASFRTIGWNATVPPNTTLELQLRAAGTAYGIQKEDFTGPDGTVNTTYASESLLPGGNLTDRWVQFKAILRTADRRFSPALDSVTVSYRLRPPAPTLLLPENGAWVNRSVPVFRWRFNGAEPGPQGGFEWQLDPTVRFDPPLHSSGEMGSGQEYYTAFRPLEEGSWYWRVRTRDAEGDWGPFSSYRTLRIDLAPPEPFACELEPAGWTAGPCTLQFRTKDALSGMDRYEVAIDGSDLGAKESPFIMPDLPDGGHYVVVRAFDLAGNCAEARASVLVDRGAPEPFWPEALPPSWANGEPTVLFNTTDAASGVDRYEVRVGAGGFTRQVSPFRPQGLADGEHTVVVRAFDRAGNFRDGSVALFLDRTAPGGPFLSMSPAGWTSGDPELAFSATDNSSGVDRFEVRVNDGSWNCETSPCVLGGLPDGISRVAVRAYDRAGNLAEGSLTAMMDRTPPEPFKPLAEPEGWTRRDPSIRFNATDRTSGIERYELRIDDGNFTTRANPAILLQVPEGRHEVTVRAFDRAGNFRDGNASVLIDRTAPGDLRAGLAGGKRTTAKAGVTLAMTATDPLSGLDAMCFSNDGLDYSGWVPFSPIFNWTLAGGPGTKAVHVRVRDRAGNEVATVAVIDYSPASTGAFPYAAAAGAVLALVAITSAAFLYRRGRKKRSAGR